MSLIIFVKEYSLDLSGMNKNIRVMFQHVSKEHIITKKRNRWPSRRKSCLWYIRMDTNFLFVAVSAGLGFFTLRKFYAVPIRHGFQNNISHVTAREIFYEAIMHVSHIDKIPQSCCILHSISILHNHTKVGRWRFFTCVKIW